jgi:UV DNA damage endonuclease
VNASNFIFLYIMSSKRPKKKTKKRSEPKIRLGYACLNTYLRRRHIFSSRTARQDTIKKEGLGYAVELLKQNLQDTLEVLKWNERNKIRLFRLSSEIAPHITNPYFIAKKDQNNPKVLAYSLEPVRKLLQQIGDYAKRHGHRITFHPGQFNVLGSPNKQTVIRTIRELYFHAKVFDMMGLDNNSVLVVHGGGVYGDKVRAMRRWVSNFNKMPINVKRRLVIENDETCYSIEDVLTISKNIKPFPGCRSKKYKIPVVFDIFHYYCYNVTIARRRADGMEQILDQKPMQELFPHIIESWKGGRIKMHHSEQGRGPLGKHSYYIKEIPKLILEFRRTYKVKLDLMIEAKGKEQAVIRLRKKCARYTK